MQRDATESASDHIWDGAHSSEKGIQSYAATEEKIDAIHSSKSAVHSDRLKEALLSSGQCYLEREQRNRNEDDKETLNATSLES